MHVAERKVFRPLTVSRGDVSTVISHLSLAQNLWVGIPGLMLCFVSIQMGLEVYRKEGEEGIYLFLSNDDELL